MQDRYVGDVGDYGKYALLRQLSGVTDAGMSLRLGIVWCLFPNEAHNNDGKHTSYLRNQKMRLLDPVLYDHLRQTLELQKRSVQTIAQGSLFTPNTVFFDDLVCPFASQRSNTSHRLTHREAWLASGLRATRDCDLVFFDPDNGIAPQTIQRGHPRAGKYIFWEEVIPFVQRGQSLVIYHHINRLSPAKRQVTDLIAIFREKLPMAATVVPLLFRRGSCRVFWIIPSTQHYDLLMSRVQHMMESDWRDHFEIARVAAF